MDKPTPMTSTLIVLRDRAQTQAHRRRSILSEMVAREVIPTLRERYAKSSGEPPVSAADIAALVDLSLHTGPEATAEFALAMLNGGHTAETLYLRLLAPAAGLLGAYWADDICNFADVTLGLVNLQGAKHALRAAFFAAAPAAPSEQRAVLLVSMAGEQHGFGLSMLADFFERAHWTVCLGASADPTALCERVRRQRFDVVGLSVSCDDALAPATQLIAAIRQASCYPEVAIMVGGPCLIANPALVEQIGADATAMDAAEAVMRAAELSRIRRKR